MTKRLLSLFWLFILSLCAVVYLFVAGIDYIRAIWELKLPVFARKISGDGSGLRVYRGPGYRINVRGSYSPWGTPEGPAMMDFYLFGRRIGGAYQDAE